MTDPNQPRTRPPAPTGISEQAQHYLDNPQPYGGATHPTDTTDTEGWLRYVEAQDAQLVEAISRWLPADPPVQCHEQDVDGVQTYVIRPNHIPEGEDGPLYLEIHGGALVLGGGAACKVMATLTAMGRDMVTWAVDYRMPPLHPFPSALDDCMTVYRRALDSRGADNVFVGGGSAGGNLAAALLLRAKDEGLPMPAGLVLLTPEVDLTESGDTFQTLLGIDTVLEPLMEVNLLYADGHDLSDPYLSPLFGDVTGFPPTFLQSGTRDLFLSNTVRMHRKLRAAGVSAELHVWDAMPHGGFGGAPEDIELAMELARFLAQHRR